MCISVSNLRKSLIYQGFSSDTHKFFICFYMYHLYQNTGLCVSKTPKKAIKKRADTCSAPPSLSVAVRILYGHILIYIEALSMLLL